MASSAKFQKEPVPSFLLLFATARHSDGVYTTTYNKTTKWDRIKSLPALYGPDKLIYLIDLL